MSEEVVKQPDGVSTILANPNDKVPPEKLLELMQVWRGKVEEEIADYDGKKGEIFKVYKRQKELYDKWLSGPLGKMKKLDKLIAGRKKVLLELDGEIKKLKASTETPTEMVQTNVVNGEVV